MPEIAAGLHVTPKVRLVQPLGQGGMGDVWIADHTTLQTRVAVKFLTDELLGDAEALARFEREAAAVVRIKSPHVVQILDFGRLDERTPFMVMELMEGETLQQRLDRDACLSLAEVCQVTVQVARALTAAHSAGLVHRDIKPDNIFLAAGADGPQVKVFDFGIAREARLPAVQRLTNSGAMIGTPEYMSPEQIVSSSTVDHQADLWALAVVTYEMLAGVPPFQGDNIGKLCAVILGSQYAPVTAERRDLPLALDGWFARCFDEDPARRFGSARDLALALLEASRASHHDLGELLVGAGPASPDRPDTGVTTLAGSTSEKKTVPRLRFRGARAPLLAVAGLLAALAVVVWARSGPSPAQARGGVVAVLASKVAAAAVDIEASPAAQISTAVPAPADDPAAGSPVAATNTPAGGGAAKEAATARATAPAAPTGGGSGAKSPTGSGTWNNPGGHASKPSGKGKKPEDEDPGF